MRSGNDSHKGLYQKFVVTRTDGRSAPGEKHARCQYFVLDVDHDEFAWAAMETYEERCAHKFPRLAIDLMRMRVAARDAREKELDKLKEPDHADKA